MDKIASKYKMIIGELWDLCSVHAILLHAQTIFVEDESSAVLKDIRQYYVQHYSAYSMDQAKNLLPCTPVIANKT